VHKVAKTRPIEHADSIEVPLGPRQQWVRYRHSHAGQEEHLGRKGVQRDHEASHLAAGERGISVQKM
jgi:hypothetical protein